jgi:predicted flap endonuclease-1-like 5' DNA nuclease
MYLLSQIWMFMGLAAIVGFIAGWWFGRCRCNAEQLTAERDAALAKVRALENQGQGSLAARAAPMAGGPIPVGTTTLGAASKAAPMATQIYTPQAQKAPPAKAPEPEDTLDLVDIETPPSPPPATTAGAPAVSGLDDQLTTAPAAGAVAAPNAPDAGPPIAPFAADPVRDVARTISNANFTPSPLAAMDLEALESLVLDAAAGVQPMALLGPMSGEGDDLKEIGGIGPTNEAWLHEHGIYHFWQIATLEAPGVAWLANNLPTFGKRVYRENWMDQATRLARGELTDAKKKYQEGKHI